MATRAPSKPAYLPLGAPFAAVNAANSAPRGHKDMSMGTDGIAEDLDDLPNRGWGLNGLKNWRHRDLGCMSTMPRRNGR